MSASVEVAMVAGPVDEAMFARPGASEGEGAECVFVGRVRPERHAAHGDLVALEYEAYEEMARTTMERIAREEAARTGCLFAGVAHSTGVVPVGAASVIVRVRSGHRAEAFEACRGIIDRVKSEAPIWKREVWRGGTTWREGCALTVEGSEG